MLRRVGGGGKRAGRGRPRWVDGAGGCLGVCGGGREGDLRGSVLGFSPALGWG